MNDVIQSATNNPGTAIAVVSLIVFVGFIFSRINQVKTGRRQTMFGGSRSDRTNHLK